jgi:hypothetical protein
MEVPDKEKKIDVYDDLPFLRSFPFDDYEIEIGVNGTDFSELGVSPILLDVLGTFGTEKEVKFQYASGDSNVMISIHIDDVLDIKEYANKIETLNEHFKYLKESIQSEDASKKISSIKKSKKFILQLDIEALVAIQFSDIIPSISEMEGAKPTEDLINALTKLSAKKVLENQKTVEEKKLVLSYLDFQLHYAMIILGIIIAAKIH